MATKLFISPPPRQLFSLKHHPHAILSLLPFHFPTSLASPPPTNNKLIVRCTRSQQIPEKLDPKVGVAVYKPRSYEVLVTDASNSLSYALDDGKLRLEIEFPPLPSNISSYKMNSSMPTFSLRWLWLGSSKKESQAECALCFPISRKREEPVNFLKQLLTRSME